jgi:hypothetical protein
LLSGTCDESGRFLIAEDAEDGRTTDGRRTDDGRRRRTFFTAEDAEGRGGRTTTMKGLRHDAVGSRTKGGSSVPKAYSLKPTAYRARTRGVILLAALGAFLVLAILAATAAAVLPASQQAAFVSADSTLSFYAADGGIEMALKEYSSSTDLDGDGTVGGISSDGSSANDFSIGEAKVHVDVSDGTFTSTGCRGDARRRIEVVVR